MDRGDNNQLKETISKLQIMLFSEDNSVQGRGKIRRCGEIQGFRWEINEDSNSCNLWGYVEIGFFHHLKKQSLDRINEILDLDKRITYIDDYYGWVGFNAGPYASIESVKEALAKLISTLSGKYVGPGYWRGDD